MRFLTYAVLVAAVALSGCKDKSSGAEKAQAALHHEDKSVAMICPEGATGSPVQPMRRVRTIAQIEDVERAVLRLRAVLDRHPAELARSTRIGSFRQERERFVGAK